MRTTLPAGFLAVPLLTLLMSSGAEAKSGYVNDWKGLYPNSLSDDNVLNGTGSACQLCHRDTGGGPFNAYGWEVRKILNGGGGILNALMQAEPFDSDFDPTGSTNLDEIDLDTQPGWTDGPNNTIYYKNGSTDVNQMPPGGIQGSLDPDTCPDSIYCDTNPDNFGDISIDTCDCSSGSINITLSNAPSGQFGYLLIGQGTVTVTDPPGAAGDLCLGGSPIGRYTADPRVTDGSGSFSTDILNAVSGGGGGGIPTIGGNLCSPAGQTWNFQNWFRDGMNPSKFSKALTVTFQ